MTPERVLEALAKDPALLWKVALGLRLLGPWESLDPNYDAKCRWDPWRRQRATLRPYEDDRGIEWRVCCMSATNEPETTVVGGVTTPRDRILAEADRVLREAGYVLVNSKVI